MNILVLVLFTCKQSCFCLFKVSRNELSTDGKETYIIEGFSFQLGSVVPNSLPFFKNYVKPTSLFWTSVLFRDRIQMHFVKPTQLQTES